MTVQEFINLAMRDAGIISQGQTPNTDESADALITLNEILGSWSLDGSLAYDIVHSTFAISALVDHYTVGVGGAWATTVRPIRITGAMAYSGVFRQPVEVLPMAEFRRRVVGIQGITAALPGMMGVDHASGFLNVRLDPMPNAAVGIEVDYWTALAAFATLASAVNMLIPGYELALRYELAVNLAHSFGLPISTELAANYQVAMQRIGQAHTLGPPAAPQAPPPKQQ